MSVPSRAPGTVRRLAALARFNRQWASRLDLFRRYVGPPWWAPGLLVTPEIRRVYNLWLPFDEYRHDLRSLARDWLPHPSWVPRSIVAGATRRDSALSFPDFWRCMPSELAGRVTLQPDEVLPLLCAIASPPRYGTAADRYPLQRQEIAAFAASLQHKFISYCDLGCGTGEGTSEMTSVLRRATGRSVHTLGITLEPLEAWMARNRHSPPENCSLSFVAADVRLPPTDRVFDIITANGLAGGPMLCAESSMIELLQAMQSILSPRGLVAVANRFHRGHQSAVESFAAQAGIGGWTVDGTFRELILRPGKTTK